jgi:hypothetical protein
MKNLILIFVLIFSLKFYAQDPQLFENTWYLHNLIINGQTLPPPSNSEVPYIPLDFFENGNDDFTTTVCNSFSGTLVYGGSENFTIQDYSLTLIFCDLEENTIYEGIYLGFFFDPTTQDPYIEPFPYTITVNGSAKTLIIENVNGDQAIYGNEILSTIDFKSSKLAIYPNPATDLLLIESSDKMINEIKIINVKGEKILKIQNFESKNNPLNIRHLASGIYFLIAKTEKGNITFKKFIKN